MIYGMIKAPAVDENENIVASETCETELDFGYERISVQDNSHRAA